MDRTEFINRMEQMQRVSQETYSRVEGLEHKMQKLEDYVNLVMRGPKGDKGADGVDGANFDLTEEDIKNAVRDGVVEGLQEIVGGHKYDLTEEDIKDASNIPWGF